MLKSCFFNSVLDPQGVPDRPFNADDFAKYFGTLIKNGVFPNPSTNFQCIADQETMAVKMEAGICWIDGHLGYDDNVHILEIDTADSVLDRIDRIVLRKDVLDRDIHWVVKKGEMSGKPVAPTLQRDENAWELGIADVKVAHGTVSISQSMVTDTRLNTELCGLVTGVVTQIDTTTLFNQLEQWKTEYIEATNTWTSEQEQAFLNWKQLFETAATDWRAGEEQKFDEWLQSIKGKLSGDVAGNLQNQIDELKATDITLDNNTKEVEKRVKKLEDERPSQVELTIERAKWSGNKYSLEDKYPFSQYDVYILDYGETTTEAEMFAWGDAMIKGSMTENVLTAIGTKPTIDVHVVIELVKKGA